MKFTFYIFIIISALLLALLLTSCAEQPQAQLLNARGIEGVDMPLYVPANNPVTIVTTTQGFQSEAQETITFANTQSTPQEIIVPATTQATPRESVTAATTQTMPLETVIPATSQTTPQEVTTSKVIQTTQTTVAATTPKTVEQQTASAETPVPVTTTPQTTTTATAVPVSNTYMPLNYNEVRGVWISYIELQTAFAGKTENSFRANFAAILDNCQKLGINTVYVHLRAFGDAFYDSSMFPWSKYTSGSSFGNVGESPGFDPLKIMLEEAHKRKISFHGWINPMRLMNDADMDKLNAALPVAKMYNDSSKKGTYIVKVGDFWYLNPAYAEVQALIAQGAAEILNKYDMDGLHIDDYFYPPGCTESFDSDAFKASGQASLSEFRLANCTQMVKRLYSAVKTANPNALFGISPQGSIKNCYDIYADVKLWSSQSGYCDYIAPQIYYGFDNASQPFDKCLSEWEELVSGTKIKLVIGLAVYKIGYEDMWAGDRGKNEWITVDDILTRQIELSKTTFNYGGVIFFSYRFLMGQESNAVLVNMQLEKAGII